MINIQKRVFTPWITPEWRWWRRFLAGVYFRNRQLRKKRFLQRLWRLEVKLNELAGTPRKRKAFNKWRIPKRIKNKFHFTTMYNK